MPITMSPPEACLAWNPAAPLASVTFVLMGSASSTPPATSIEARLFTRELAP